MTNPTSQDGMSVEEVLERAEPGQWVVHTSWGIEVRKIGKVTAKLVKFDGGWAPRQVEHSKVIAVFADKEDADRFKQSVEGAHGEYSRRVSAARVEYNTRCADAKEAYDKAVAALRSRASSALSREVGKGVGRG